MNDLLVTLLLAAAACALLVGAPAILHIKWINRDKENNS